MVMSWFTRNAADHARDTAQTRCAARFSRCTLDCCVDSVGEFVIKVSVVATRLSMRSMNLGFSGDDQGRQLISLKYGK